MRKICIILLLMCVFLFDNKKDNTAFASSETTTYAKAYAGCNLYKNDSMVNSLENVYFQIPESYFVMVVKVVNDEILKVQYNNYVGYVETSKVLICNFTPIVKTLDNISFDIKSTAGTQVWSYPSATSSVLATISAGTKGIKYIASVYGTIPMGGESNLWYYVSYTPTNNSTSVYEGYVYSENITNLSEIVLNTETNPEIIGEQIDIDDNYVFISSTIKTIIVAVVAIPIILFIIIILYKITKKFKKNTVIQQEVKKLQSANFGEDFNPNTSSSSINKFKNCYFIKKPHVSHETNFVDVPYDEDEDLL